MVVKSRMYSSAIVLESIIDGTIFVFPFEGARMSLNRLGYHAQQLRDYYQGSPENVDGEIWLLRIRMDGRRVNNLHIHWASQRVDIEGERFAREFLLPSRVRIMKGVEN